MRYEPLPLYEAGNKEPRAFIDADGKAVLPDGAPVQLRRGLGAPAAEGLPKILFADVPTVLHLSNGLTLSPLAGLGDVEREEMGL